jgi:hypothetical protein
MFIGGLPDGVLHQIVHSTDIGTWPSVWVMCSGAFRIERTLHKYFPALEIHSNDVSLLTCAVGTLASGGTFDIRYKGALEWFEEHLADAGFGDRVSALLVAGQISRFATGKANAYKAAHVEHIKGRFPELLDKARQKIANVTANLSVDSFHPGDFRDQPTRALEAGGGVIGFPPTYKGGYEALYRFLHGNIDWPEPEYGVFDPETLPAVVDKIEASGIPWIIGCDRTLEGRAPLAEFRPGRNHPLYTFGTLGKPSLRIKPATKAEPFAYAPLELEKINADSKVKLIRIDGAKANFIKDIYLAKHITRATGMINFAVLLDGMLAGLMIYALSQHQVYSPREIYLLSDLSTSREAKLSKLIARLALSSTVLRELEKWIVRPFDFVVTTAFSKHPVSMKYRGVFDLLKRQQTDEGYMLNYGHARINETPQQIFSWWWKKYGSKQSA